MELINCIFFFDNMVSGHAKGVLSVTKEAYSSSQSCQQVASIMQTYQQTKNSANSVGV